MGCEQIWFGVFLLYGELWRVVGDRHSQRNCVCEVEIHLVLKEYLHAAIELAICKTILERGHEKWNGKHQADGRGGDGVFV